MIRFIPLIDNIKSHQRGDLPAHTVMIDDQPPDVIQRKSLPIIIAACLMLFLSVLIKTRISQVRVLHPLSIIGGFLIGFLCLAIHEWLHAIVYPKQATVTLGKLKGKLLFVALASYPLSRRRFILMCLLPYILGVLPLAAFLLSPPNRLIVNGILFGMASMGLISPYMDLYNVITVLKYSHKTDRIMFYEDGLYKIEK